MANAAGDALILEAAARIDGAFDAGDRLASLPDAPFDLAAWSQADGVAAMNLGLAGGFGDRWTWSADYARRFGIDAGKGGWFVGLRRDF